MKKLLFLVAAVSLSASAFTQSEDPALRAELQKHYRQFDQFVTKLEIPSVLNMFHKGFTTVDVQGKAMNYPEVKSNYLQMVAATKDVTLKTTVVHVGGNFDEAMAWISVVVHYTAKQGDRWVKMKLTRRYAETLKRAPDGWKFFYSQGLPLDEPWPFA